MSRPGTWQPGETGNPNGRPLKNRALTTLLERAGSKSLTAAGKRTSGKRWLAHALWELVTTGKVTMPDGSAMQVEPRDWLDTVKWLYGHVDGPARQVSLDVRGYVGLAIIEQVVSADITDSPERAPSTVHNE